MTHLWGYSRGWWDGLEVAIVAEDDLAPGQHDLADTGRRVAGAGLQPSHEDGEGPGLDKVAARSRTAPDRDPAVDGVAWEVEADEVAGQGGMGVVHG